MFVFIAEAYNKVWDSLPPMVRRALLFGLGAFFLLSAVLGGSPLRIADRIAR